MNRFYAFSKILPTAIGLSLLFVSFAASAQMRLRDVARRDAATGWIYFNPGVWMMPEAFFSTFQAELGASAADHFELVRTWTDDIDMTHHLFHQYHEGVRVEAATMLLHERQGELSTAHGQIVTGIARGARPSIGASAAIQKSVETVGAQHYAWESDPSAYPQPELLYVLFDHAGPISPENITLAYRTTIHATEPLDPTDVYVDAHTGDVLYHESLVQECIPGTGVTNYYGTQNINVETYGTGYELLDNCTGVDVHTLTYFGLEVTNASNVFGASTQNQNSAHWCARNTLDYFLSAHNRNSYNNAGGDMQTRVGGSGCGAYWLYASNGQGYAILKNGDGGVSCTSLATLDVVGHEFGHGVVRANGLGGVGTNYEPGALNESFGDIFGTMVEFYAPGNHGDYFFGDDCVPLSQGGMERNLKNPKSRFDPDTYKGQYWVPPVPYVDRGGIHTNCGIQNHWFYLLAEGSGDGNSDEINDNNDKFKVYGIGRAKAAAIAYRNLTTYLPPGSNYFAARAGSIQAAKDIYGANSHEACQVANAWYAVGVGKDNLMIKDNLADSGAEPSNGIDMFLAYDIWVRKQPNGFLAQNQHQSEDLMATVGPNPSYVYVKIRNIGDVTSQCGTLKMYWSRASTGLTWPQHWNNYACTNGQLCGDQFRDCSGAYTDFGIPPIPAGGEHIVQIQWCPPNPAVLPGTGDPLEDRHFCLLARIERDNDPMHDEQQNVSVNYNTWQNNNIAWKNIRIQPSNGVYIANPTGMLVRTRRVIDGNQSIRYRIEDKNGFRGQGDILVQLPDSLFYYWVIGGMEGSGFEQLSPQVFKLTDSIAYLEGIKLPYGEDYSIGLAFNPFEGLPISIPSNFLATITQMEKNSPGGPYEVVGGEGFEFRVNPYPIYLGNDLHICKGDSITLTANLDNWNQNDSTSIFWDSGQTGPTITVAPDSSQTFTAVVTNGDGYFASSFVNVYVANPVVWFRDADGDGFGFDQAEVAFSCQAPAGYVDNFLDCNDNNNDIHPGAAEFCNGVDDNCDGQIDEGLACYETSVVFDGLLHTARNNAGLLLSGDSLIIANTAGAADTFAIVVDLANSLSHDLWYSFVAAGAGVTKNYLGTVNDGPLQSLGAATLTQTAADGFAATIFIPGADTLRLLAYRNDTLVHEGSMLNGASANYDATPSKWDSHVVFTENGLGPYIVTTTLTISSAKKVTLSTSAGNVLCDVVQFTPTAPASDRIALKAVDISATGLSALVFNRAIAIQTDNALTLCPGDTAQLAATTAEGAGFQWQKDLIDISGAVGANYQAAEAGNYRVKVTTGNTTYTSSQLSVTVLTQAECDAINTIQPEASQTDAIRIFPNPNPGIFTVELSEPAVSGMSFRVVGLTGQVLLEKQMEAGSMLQIVLAGDLPAGLYFLQLAAEGRIVAVQKFVKQ